MTLYEYAFQPFADYGFMRRALVTCLALAIGGTPLGCFLTLRRMTLVGDAMSHAILPGVAIMFLAYGVSLWPMTLGGLAAGLLVALIAGAVSRFTLLKEDASFTGGYLLSLAAGVMIISLKGSPVDVMHILFGNILAVGNDTLYLVTSICTLSTLIFALIYRSLIAECLDPLFMRAIGGKGAWVHQLFLGLLVLNLVAAFQAIGTLMSLGIIVLPAISARLWSAHIDAIIAIAVAFASLSAYIGLLLSYHYSLPSGPSIVLTAGAIYIASILFGKHGSILSNFYKRKHYAH